MSHSERARPPRLEQLEDRLTPAQFGVPWADPMHLSVSFAPDGTRALGLTSSLYATLDAQMPRATWQGAILRAAQTWSEAAGLNVALVADRGQALGTPGPTQADGRFGDIRVGALPMAAGELAEAVPPDPFFSGTLAGDVVFNSEASFTPQSLYGVALHELGHALGLAPSTDPRSVMWNAFTGNLTLAASDVAAIRGLYGLRGPDLGEGAKGNDTLKNATAMKASAPSAEYAGATPVVSYGDISTRADVDYHTLEVLPGYSGPVTFRLQAAGVSQLAPRLTVLSAKGAVLATGVAQSGGTVTVTLPAVTPGAKVAVRVEAAGGGAVAVGRYGLGATYDGLARPTVLSLDAVLRGPYDGVKAEELGEVFTSPATALLGDDLHTDDTLATAGKLTAVPGAPAGTRWTGTGSLADSADADFYKVRAPASPGVQVLTVTVRGTSPVGVTPALSVLDGNGLPVVGRVLAVGNGRTTLQFTGVAARSTFYLKAGPGPGVGNYALDAAFGTHAAQVQTFAAVNLGAGQSAADALYLGQAQVFGLLLGVTGPAGSGARLTVRDASGAVVLVLDAQAGQTAGGAPALLVPGAYSVTLTATGGPVSATLYGSSLSDPLGPQPGDSVLQPMYLAPVIPPELTGPVMPMYFLYPGQDLLTTDPFFWTPWFPI